MTEAQPGVRVAGEPDVVELSRLYTAHLTYHEPFDAAFRPRADGDYARLWRGVLADHDERTFVAEAPAGLVGFARCRLCRQPAGRRQRLLDALLRRRRAVVNGQIVDFFVDADHRRAGVGTALLAAAKDWFGQHGIATMCLSVWVANEAGLAFWQAMGMRPQVLSMRCSLDEQQDTSTEGPRRSAALPEGTG